MPDQDITPAIDSAEKQYSTSVNNYWVHSSRSRLHDDRQWDKGKIEDGSYPTSMLNTSKTSDKAILTLEYGKASVVDGIMDPDTSITTSNQYLSLLNDSVADGFDAIHYLWETKAKSFNDFVEVSDYEIAGLLGIKKTKHRTIHNKSRKSISDLVQVLSIVNVDLKATLFKNTKSGKRVKDSFEVKSPLLIIRSRIKKTREVDDVKKWTRMSWYVKPGDALLPFLDRPNKQFALLSKKLLQYRTIGCRFAKRIGRSGTYFIRANFTKTGGTTRITVRALLEDAGIQFDNKRPRRFIEQFESAKETLLRDQIFQRFYYEDERMNDFIIQDSTPKNFSKTWLDSFVVIEPPEEIVKQYLKMVSRKQVEQKMPNSADPLEEIRNRIDDGIAKKEIAAQFEISTAYLSMLLNGKRNISKKLLNKARNLGYMRH